jgi:hypothetical protein
MSGADPDIRKRISDFQIEAEAFRKVRDIPFAANVSDLSCGGRHSLSPSCRQLCRQLCALALLVYVAVGVLETHRD